MGIIEKIQNSDGWAVGALLALHRLQTPDEQAVHGTIEVNNMGFNKFDATYLTSLTDQYYRTKTLSQKQIHHIKLALPKYWRQLQTLSIREVQLSPPPKVKEVQEADFATDGRLAIKFLFEKSDVGKEKFLKCLQMVKSLEGQRAIFFPDKDHVWKADLTPTNVTILKHAGFQLSDKLGSWHKAINRIPSVRTKFNIKGLKLPIRPFQHLGVGFITSRQGRALIADDMGLGKTVQALAWIHYKKAYPALIVVPATAKLNWEAEVKKWLPDNISCSVLFGLNGNHASLVSNRPKITVINYDILDSWSSTFDNINTLVLDEAHFVKNKKAKRSMAVRTVAKKAKNIIALSGTPIINRPAEFFNVLNLLAPEHFNNFWYYAKKFCSPKYNRFGWNFTGSSNTEELHKLLIKTVMIRRTKSEVLKELPTKVRTVVPIEIDNKAEYQRAQDDFVKWVRDNFGEAKAVKASNAEALARIEGLKQLTIKGKLKNIVSWIQDFLESDQKLVVFAIHHFTIDALLSSFPKEICVKLDGRDEVHKRQQAINSFQNDPKVRLFVGNIKAAGTAINLTAASNTCFTELGWTPGEHEQAEDRVHRIGQEADSVSAYYLLGVKTIEEEIAELIDNKRQVLSRILDGKEVGSEGILTELLNNILGKE
ncbi:MAG: DEAD/DEAH box helicase [Syntrophorhabdaceae bacterium]|nr:DEAD/DEAH box helicase [Syntrophorhabdaceae bacterium]